MKQRRFFNRYRALIVISTLFIVVIISTYFVSLLVRGYRPDLKNQTLMPTGILVANSIPEGASVFINDKLVTATDDTLNLLPKEYQIRIEKEGYFPWEKNINIEKEIVKQTNTFLFKSVPDLKPLTLSGADKPILSPDGTKIIYVIRNAKQTINDGLWILDLAGTPLNFLKPSLKQIVQSQANLDWSKAELTWSLDSKRVLAVFRSGDQKEKEIFGKEWFKNVESAYLLSADQLTPAPQLKDISLRLSLMAEEWNNETKATVGVRLKKLPIELQRIATESAQIIGWSNDEEKIVYLASKSAEIPENLLPHPPAKSDQPESRKIEPGKIYAYDLKEDVNFFIANSEELAPLSSQNHEFKKPLVLWLATNRHLIFIEKGQAKVVEYDGQNKQTVFGEKFENGYVFPWPDATRIVILTSLHPESPSNLYAITIR